MAHSDRVRELVGNMTVDEKADIVTGKAFWTTRPVERLGVPSMTVTDGPNGARGDGLLGTGTPTACIPAGSVLGATWDPALLEELGALLGDESIAKGANVLLAPTINLHRNPLGGRNFECYSEDPFLTGRLAVGYITGVQSRGVAVTAKHLVANDSEFERNSIDSQVDERTLREVYLAPFEAAVKDAGAWGVMSSYNRVNGTFASENEWLLRTVLRQQWGFDGFVVSDWYGARSTGPSLRAGLSLEMPGPGNWYGRENIAAALAAGDCSVADLDAAVAEVLTVLERTGAFDGRGGEAEKQLDRVEDRELIRRAAAAGTVLVRNDGVLPLDGAALASIAVIGPNARAAKVMGGGSAGVKPYRVVNPLDALRTRLPDVDVRFARGCDIDRSVPALAAPMLDTPFVVEFFGGHDGDGPVLATQQYDSGHLVFFGSPADGVPADACSWVARATFTPETSGPHEVVLVQSGRMRVVLDDEVVVDGTVGEHPASDDFFGMAKGPIVSTVDLVAGESVAVRIEGSNRDAALMGGYRVGVVSRVERDLLAEAEEVAAAADVAVVVVGTNDDWETEGRDREQFALPGDQAELIERVAAANPRTIVVVNTGGPHAMDWLDAPAAVLVVGFAGQELGDALVDVLLGEVDPGGRMPTTIPARYEHNPAYLSYPGENSVVRYAEGLYIGHRWFDARHIEPAVPFGHGLSYADLRWSTPRVSGAATTDVAGPVVVEVDVVNHSDRPGTEVVQVYVEPVPALVHRPVRELKGFAKVHVDAGATATARIELDRRAFAFYDPGDQFYDTLPALAEVPRESGPRHVDPGWYVAPGTYGLAVARSSGDIVATLPWTLDGPETVEAP